MDSSGSSIGEGDWTTSGGDITSQFYGLVGIGQYTDNVTYTVNAGTPGQGTRTASFGNLYWSYSGNNAAALLPE